MTPEHLQNAPVPEANLKILVKALESMFTCQVVSGKVMAAHDCVIHAIDIVPMPK